MIPGLGGGFDPRKMAGMMKKLGIKQEEIDASKVIIEKNDGGKLVINNPSVQRIEMHGQESFQISGDLSEDTLDGTSEGISEEDVQLVIEKTGKGEEEVRKVLGETGDIAKAI